MNIVDKLTLRQLKKNKRRTFVTIIGVIISVAMLTAVATLITSFTELMKQQTIANTGEWHFGYADVNKEEIDTIEQDKTTKDVVLSDDVGYAFLEGSQNEDKPYVFVKAFNKQGFSNFQMELMEGRFPKEENEIIISEAIETDAGVALEVGDTVKLELGERMNEEQESLVQGTPLQYSYETDEVTEELDITSEAEYKIVGMMEHPNWEPYSAPGYTVVTYLDMQEKSAEQTVNAFVTWKKVNNKQKEYASELAEKLGITDFGSNSSLLRYYGVFSNHMRNTLITFGAVIILIIIVGSVSLIYNAFAISVAERSRQLGMLSSVGATKQQKRNSVFFEGFIIGLFSIPIGVVSGIAGIGVTFIFMNDILSKAQIGITEPIRITVTPWTILVSCLLAILTIFISTYIPARRASRITAIDAIRQAHDIKLTKKKIKTNRLIRKIFGIEAEISMKNLKRNKRRYIATIFSLVISIVLFLSVSYFTSSIKQVNSMTQQDVNADIVIYKMGQTEEQWERLVRKTAGIESVTDYNKSSMLRMKTNLEKLEIASELYDVSSRNEKGQYSLMINIHTLEDEQLKAYAEEVGADFQKLQSEKRGIVHNKSVYKWEEQYYDIQPLQKSVGEEVELFGDNESESYFVDTVQIEAFTEKLPLGVSTQTYGNFNLIVSEQTYTDMMSKMVQPDRHVAQSALYIESDDPIKTEEEIDDIREGSIALTNYYANQQQNEQVLLILSIFTYGFITLITLISIANIFNTISTSISLRKREFAMLKSIGMTPKGFNKLINYESIFYGLKALLYGIPISIGLMYLMHQALADTFQRPFTLPWDNILFVTIAIFLIVGSAMLYASSKVKKENIIDTLKQENI